MPNWDKIFTKYIPVCTETRRDFDVWIPKMEINMWYLTEIIHYKCWYISGSLFHSKKIKKLVSKSRWFSSQTWKYKVLITLFQRAVPGREPDWIFTGRAFPHGDEGERWDNSIVFSCSHLIISLCLLKSK